MSKSEENIDRKRMLKDLERMYFLLKGLKEQHDREFAAIHREMLKVFSEISHSLPMEARVRAAQVRSDELYPEAEQLVRAAGEATTSYLQRRLGIGYARAAALIDMLEERGVVSGPRGAAPRKVLLSPAVEKVLKKIEEQLAPKGEEKKKEKKNEK